MYFEELNGDFSAGLWRKNPNGRKDIHHGSHGRIELTPDDDAESSSPFTDDFLDGCEYGSTIRNRTGARRKKKKRKNDDDSSSSLYGAIV